MVPREGNRTAIIVGTIVVIFIFALVLFTFGTIFYATCKKRRAATSSASHGINGINGINEINGSNGAALDDVSVSCQCVRGRVGHYYAHCCGTLAVL